MFSRQKDFLINFDFSQDEMVKMAIIGVEKVGKWANISIYIKYFNMAFFNFYAE